VISICLDTDTTLWNNNEKWVEVDSVAAANGDGTYTVNTTGIAAGTYYVGGYMYNKDTKKFLNAHLTSPITIADSQQQNQTPTLTLTGPTSGTYTVGQPVTVTWTAANMPANGVISICLDTDTTLWNNNEKWVEVDSVAAANGDGAYTINTTGIAAGTYYVGGYMYNKDTKKFLNAHLTTPITITAAPVTTPTLTLTGPTSGTYTAGQSVTVTWTAANAPANGVISICLDTDTTLWNKNEKWVEVDQVTAANGDGSYTFSTSGITPGTYYVGGYLYNKDTKKFTNAHLTSPITIVNSQQQNLTPSFSLTGPTSGTYTVGQSVTIAWTAANVPANGVISLCLDADATLWNKNEKWVEVDQVTAANGDGSYTFNTSGFTPGTYYVGGYLYNKDTKKFTNAHLTTPITLVQQAASSSAMVYQPSAAIPAANTDGSSAAGAAGTKISKAASPAVNSNTSNKDYIFSSNALVESTVSKPATDKAKTDLLASIFFQPNAKEKFMALDKVLWDQDFWG
jgi:hypothetical protein